MSEVCFDCQTRFPAYSDFVELVFPPNYAGSGVDVVLEFPTSTTSFLGRAIKPDAGSCVVVLAGSTPTPRPNVQPCLGGCSISGTEQRTVVVRNAGSTTALHRLPTNADTKATGDIATFVDTATATPRFSKLISPLFNSLNQSFPCTASGTTSPTAATTTTVAPATTTSKATSGTTTTTATAAVGTSTTATIMSGGGVGPTQESTLVTAPSTAAPTVTETAMSSSFFAPNAPVAAPFPVVAVAAGAGGGAVGLILIILLIYCLIRRKNSGSGGADLPYSERDTGNAINMTPAPQVYKGKLAQDRTEDDADVQLGDEDPYGFIPKRNKK